MYVHITWNERVYDFPLKWIAYWWVPFGENFAEIDRSSFAAPKPTIQRTRLFTTTHSQCEFTKMDILPVKLQSYERMKAIIRLRRFSESRINTKVGEIASTRNGNDKFSTPRWNPNSDFSLSVFNFETLFILEFIARPRAGKERTFCKDTNFPRGHFPPNKSPFRAFPTYRSYSVPRREILPFY